METLFWVLAIVAVVGLVAYYLVSQKKVSVPGIAKKEEKGETSATPSEGGVGE